MILIEATIKYKGYDPNELSKGSHKRICVSCDKCGRVRYINYQLYRNLCLLCANKEKDHCKKISKSKLGKNNPCYGRFGNKHPLYNKHHSDKTKLKMSKSKIGNKNHLGIQQSIESKIKSSCTRQGIDVEDFNGFVRDKERIHVLHKSKCIKLNTKIKGFEFHHIMKSVGIYISKDIHRSICHNLKNNQGINEINELAYNFLVYNF